MNILFLMGGLRTDKKNDQYPIYLTEINEKTILEQQIEYINKINPRQLIFCVHEYDVNSYYINTVLKQIDSTSIVIPIKAQTKGAICSALLASEHINNDSELILIGIDDFMDVDSKIVIDYFRSNDADAGVVSFTSLHPRYSFAKTITDNQVIEFSEKLPISNNALVSFYYFKHGKDFVACAKEVILKDSPIHDAFFISQAMNEMILNQKKVCMFKISNDRFHPLKTEKQLAEYILENSERRIHK